MVLNEHGLLAQLSALITADDVTQGKPHPETFVRAAELMGVAPQHCVVFEDTDMGRKAAVDGGMACFMVDNTRLIY
jgi:HAD superfamily hydrolase (TIGR01509 family)